MVALAGPNGAGKTTFYNAHLRPAALRFLNADVLARELKLEPYAAAKVANALRRELLRRGESFVFETVFSDPVRDKLGFLLQAAQSGYTVVLCYVGIASAHIAEERVAMRVAQGGHDVPTDKIKTRFPRTLANLKAGVRELPHVLIFDNSDLTLPFQLVAAFEAGSQVHSPEPTPPWLRPLLP